MTQYQGMKLKIKLGFCVAIFSILSLGTYQIYSIWIDSAQEISSKELHNVHVADLVVSEALINGSKFLDVAMDDLRSQSITPNSNTQAIEGALQKSVSTFKINTWFNVYGNLLFVDASGNVLAQTNGPVKHKINVSDRIYFKSLKENSNRSFIIGPEVIARSNGKRVFHMATPILDDKGAFNGLLVIQIDADKFRKDLIDSFGDDFGELGFYLMDGALAFSLSNSMDESASVEVSEEVFRRVKSTSNSVGIIRLPANAFLGFGAIIAHAFIPEFGLYVVEGVSTKVIWVRTVTWGIKFLTFVLLSCLLVTYFAGLLLRSVSSIESENQLAIHDPLTHLPNRRYFDEIFPKIQGDCRRTHTPLSILFIDIDRFKDFNDLHGHECGDKALRVASHAILAIKKRPLDFFCRWGGEEFIFILPGTNQEGAIHYAQAILEAVRSRSIKVNDDVAVHITVSIGIATDPDGSLNLSDDLIKNADAAMYLAKQAGRDRYAIYSG